MLKVGDILYAKRKVDLQLTIDKTYTIVYTRNDLKFSVVGSKWDEADICILDDEGTNWWFGQIGSSECWTGWFYSEKEWKRNKNLEDLGI